MQLSRIDTYMMSIAFLTASMSKAKRLQVGAVFARDNRPLCTGWNGVLEGLSDDFCETTKYCTCYMPEFGNGLLTCPTCHGVGFYLKTKPTVIHAEMNALRFMAKAGISTDGATLYITHAPCINCAKHLAGIGLSRIVYARDYRSTEGIDFLKTIPTIEIYQCKGFSCKPVESAELPS